MLSCARDLLHFVSGWVLISAKALVAVNTLLLVLLLRLFSGFVSYELFLIESKKEAL